MLYPLDVNKQISVPYLLKIGYGKIAKIGKYLADKELKHIALFTGYGIDEIVGKGFYQGLKENGIDIAFKNEVSGVALEDIVKTAFSLPKVNAIVGVGGGVALDFAKYAAHLLQIPYISVPTSPSNDGFCSPSSSLTVEGKRKSVKSSIPFGVVIDLDIWAACPKVAIYSGIGDMVSKITALWDWKKAAEKGLDRYKDFASIISYNSLDLLFLKHSSDITSPDFQRSLANSLLMSGVAMEIAGSSRPASGSEHLISHALDMTADNHKPHGMQVGVATMLCAELQHNPNLQDVVSLLTKTGFIDFVAANPLNKQDFIRALQLAPKIKDNYYTVLSEEGMTEKAVQLTDADSTLKRLIV